MEYTIKWESNGKSACIMGKVWVPISQVLPIRWVLLHFSVLWEIDGQTNTFPIWWSIPWDGNRMGKNHPYYGRSMINNFPVSPRTMGFVAFSCTMRNWWGSPCISHMMKHTIRWDGNLMGKRHPYCRKSMSINFPDFPHTTGFVGFSHTVGNLRGNPCISHMLKYTIRWESNGKNAPILWEKYEYQFVRLYPDHGFCCIFPYRGKFMGKPMHFPYDGIG